MLKKIGITLFMPLILFGIDLRNVTKDISFVILDEVGFEKKVLNAPLMDCRNICQEVKKWKIAIPIKRVKSWKDRNTSLLKKDFVVNDTSSHLENINIPFVDFTEKISEYINKPNFIKNQLIQNRYLIAFYLGNLETELRVIKSRKDNGFNLISDINLILKAVIFKPDLKNKKFTFFKVLSGESLGLDYMRNVRELYSINYFNSEFKFFPTNNLLGYVKFKKSLANSFTQAYQNIISQFQEINEFRKLSQIQDIQNGYVILSRNRQIEVRTDSPMSFNILRNDGNLEELAWGKIDRKNQAKIIQGLNYTNILDWSYMPYWKGYLFSPSFKLGSSTLMSKDISIASISEYLISADLKMDLGYLLNNPILAEVWLNFSIYSGIESISILEKNHISNIEFNSLFGIQTDVTFRHYLKKAFFVEGGLNLGAKFSTYNLEYYNSYKNQTLTGSGNLNISSYYLGFQGGGGYSFSPNLEVFSDVAYNMPIFGNSYIEENGRVIGKDAMDYIDSQDFKYDRIFRISIGARFNY